MLHTFRQPHRMKSLTSLAMILFVPIIANVRRAKFYSVLADEVSSHAVEHLAICLHFVDEQCNVREEFVSLFCENAESEGN